MASSRRDQKIAKRQMLLAKGFCGNHTTTPVVPGLTQCYKCTANLKRRRLESISTGICPNHPRTPTPIVPNKKTCQRCLWKASENSIFREFGLSPEDYARMEYAQNRGCKICQRPCPSGKALAVDHCHKTGKIRGLLCIDCNRMIGFLETHGCLVSLNQYIISSAI